MCQRGQVSEGDTESGCWIPGAAAVLELSKGEACTQGGGRAPREAGAGRGSLIGGGGPLGRECVLTARLGEGGSLGPECESCRPAWVSGCPGRAGLDGALEGGPQPGRAPPLLSGVSVCLFAVVMQRSRGPPRGALRSARSPGRSPGTGATTSMSAAGSAA